MRFVMSRFVSANQPRGNVNYEELIKFLAKCLGENMNQQQVQPQVHQQMQPKQSVQPRFCQKNRTYYFCLTQKTKHLFNLVHVEQIQIIMIPMSRLF